MNLQFFHHPVMGENQVVDCLLVIVPEGLLTQSVLNAHRALFKGL
jgi:hypothetical protein